MLYIKKIAKMLFSIFLIGTLSFLLISLIPGEPATAVLGIESTPEELAAFRAAKGLDQNIILQYFKWLKGIVIGDFGESFKHNESVMSIISARLPITLKVAFLSTIIIFTVSIPASFILYKTKNKYVKRIEDFLVGVSISIPSFWLGMVFIFVFCIILRWFSSSYDNSLKSLILPCVVVAIPKIGVITSFLRSSLETEMRKEYIRYLYVNGLKMKWLNLYILKNSILSVIPLIGIMIIDLITGIVIIEQLFSIPGIGRLLVTSIANRDIPLVLGLIFYTSVVLVFINFFIDIVYTMIDPRIKGENQ